MLWWKTNIQNSVAPIRSFSFVAIIFTDASLTGWGAVCDSHKTGGIWSPTEKNFHINELELLAVFFGLKCFAADLRDCEILLRVDNTTAIAYINRMGGTQYPWLHNLPRDIWQWCESRRIWIFASYIVL